MTAAATCRTALAFLALVLAQAMEAFPVIAASQDPGSSAVSETKPGSPAGSASDQGQSGSPTTKDSPDEVRILREKIIELQNKGRLGFRKVELCSSVEGFGVYSPLEQGQQASRIVLYFEPSNFSTLISEGRYVVDLTVDLSIFDAAGKLIAGKENVLKINRVSRSPVIDLYYKMEINLKKPMQQHFVIKTTLHDKIKNQAVSASYKVDVRSPTNRMLDRI
ncbi:MAG: hypothetical protein HY913_02345 [Desulfomonile tiedjei]|nr:hypothetical protein [Desulfomonile tiedjei]